MKLSFLTMITQPGADLGAMPASPHMSLFLQEILRCAGPELLLERNGLEFASLPLGFGAQQASQLQPGRYVLRLSTGRILWEADLGADDLFWEPDQALPLAAATEAQASRCSCEARVGSIMVKVIAGFKGGTIRIEPTEVAL